MNKRIHFKELIVTLQSTLFDLSEKEKLVQKETIKDTSNALLRIVSSIEEAIEDEKEGKSIHWPLLMESLYDSPQMQYVLAHIVSSYISTHHDG